MYMQNKTSSNPTKKICDTITGPKSLISVARCMYYSFIGSLHEVFSGVTDVCCLVFVLTRSKNVKLRSSVQ